MLARSAIAISIKWAYRQMGIPAFLGISLHSLLDGIALGAGLILPQLGPVVLLAVIVHKMPDSMSISSILLAAGWNRGRVAILNLLFSLTTPIGALLAFLFFGDLHRKMSPSLSAFLPERFWQSPPPISCLKCTASNSETRRRCFFFWLG